MSEAAQEEVAAEVEAAEPELEGDQLAPDETEALEQDGGAEDAEPADDPEDVAVDDSFPAAPSRPVNEQAFEEAAKKGEAWWSRNKVNLAGYWDGTGANLAECPLCPDQHKGFINLDFAGQVPDVIVNVVQKYLGYAVERDYKQSGKHNPCSFCDAWGKVATGSHVGGKETVTCPECNGYGYTPPPGSNVAQLSPVGDGVTPEPRPQDDLEHGETDEMGQPRILPDGRENPNYGRRPAYWVQVEPWGDTAGLRA